MVVKLVSWCSLALVSWQQDDLLGCDCNGLEEGVLKEKDVNVAGDSGDESDEDSKGFVVASQYDPAPVSPLSPPPKKTTDM